MNLATLESFMKLTSEHVEAACSSPDHLRAFLVHASLIARPEEGAPKVLFLFSRIVDGGASWLEGDLTVEIAGDDASTRIDVFCEQGWGIRERLAPQARLDVPVDEFQRAIEISPKRFLPLRASITPTKIVMASGAPRELAPASVPELELDESSLGTVPPPPRMPAPLPEELTPLPLPPHFNMGQAQQEESDVHSKPTVRREMAIKPEARRSGRPVPRRDPRREEDD